MMKKTFILFCLALLFFGCDNGQKERNKNEPEEQVTTSLTINPGKLIALLDNNLSSYYINKGQPRGYEYEMLKLFCDENDLELQIEVISNFDYLLDSLLEGKADVAAGNLTVTGHRKEFIDFTPPILRTRQILVQRYPDNYKKLSISQRKERMITDALDLDGKTIHVNESSSYKQKLQNLAIENGLSLNIVEIDASLGIDELVEDVSNGKIEYTVLDENLANFYKKLYPNIYIETPLSLSQNIAWAINKDNRNLLELFSSWIEKNQNSTKWNMIYNRYYKHSSKEIRYQRNFVLGKKEKSISPYDEILKINAQYLNWDWRLLAALVRKESRFNPQAQSRFGAIGLMQVMPNTGKQFGCDPDQLFIPELNVRAGTRFLQWLVHFWSDRLTSLEDIEYFVIASYNVGPGHVLDAKRLAEKHGLNPDKWEDNVEIMLLNKSKPAYYKDEVVKHGYCRGREPYQYVKEIYRYYGYYKSYIPDEKNESQTASL